MGELLKNLESNNPTLVEESKNELIKSLSLTKENWLVYGMMEHFATQNSMKIVEILVKAPQSHDTFIFDKLLEWIQTNDKRNQAFKLFWLIIQKHPSWLYRVANHRLLRELLNTVKTERNFNTTLQGLFCIIILLPIIPALMNDYLHELFTIFLFLANWKATNHPELIGNQPVYLQNAIEKLFQSLYGMYPWNFVTFLREHVNDKTIKVIDPLVKNTRVHPMLLFSSPDVEKSQSRWKEMEPHDIVTECEKLAVDNAMKSHECDQEHINIPWYGRSIQVTPNQLSNERLRNTFAPISASETTTTRQQRIRSSNKWDNIWSPSSAVLATPPPTSNLAITQTPTPIFAQAIPGGQPYSSSGASPPEAAVEGMPSILDKIHEFEFLIIEILFCSHARNNTTKRLWTATAAVSGELKRRSHAIGQFIATIIAVEERRTFSISGPVFRQCDNE